MNARGLCIHMNVRRNYFLLHLCLHCYSENRVLMSLGFAPMSSMTHSVFNNKYLMCVDERDTFDRIVSWMCAPIRGTIYLVSWSTFLTHHCCETHIVQRTLMFIVSNFAFPELMPKLFVRKCFAFFLDLLKEIKLPLKWEYPHRMESLNVWCVIAFSPHTV